MPSIDAATPDVTVVWFRHDLRLDDHPALAAAASRGQVVPVVVWAPEEEGQWGPGAASRWWTHRALAALEADLEAQGGRLIVRRGPTLDALRSVAEETGAGAVVWTRRYEPAVIERDTAIKQGLRRAGLDAESVAGALLYEPWTIETKQGGPYKVFTPFWKACRAAGEPAEAESAPTLRFPRRWPASDSLESLGLLPEIDWADGMRTSWTAGASGAAAALEAFLDEGAGAYGDGRNRPDQPWTSRLSPYLHSGEIGIRRVWWAVEEFDRRTDGRHRASLDTFRAELGWREFAHHLLYHFPETTDDPLRADFRRFPWRRDDADLRAWQRGLTGYPMVDAGMRQLWRTGWMHNRVRMIAASFLVKHLLLPWQDGARWFWDTLVDADLASNTLGWQWTAGCGADAAPYFRIFNPVTQGQKFDPDGAYVRKWIPELAALPTRVLHEPWTASAATLDAAGVSLGDQYPSPIVEHGAARARALDALASITRSTTDAVAAPSARPRTGGRA